MCPIIWPSILCLASGTLEKLFNVTVLSNVSFQFCFESYNLLIENWRLVSLIVVDGRKGHWCIFSEFTWSILLGKTTQILSKTVCFESYNLLIENWRLVSLIVVHGPKGHWCLFLEYTWSKISLGKITQILSKTVCFESYNLLIEGWRFVSLIVVDGPKGHWCLFSELISNNIVCFAS